MHTILSPKLLLFVLLAGCALPKQNEEKGKTPLSISWKLLEQNYHDSGHSLVQLTIHNTSPDTLSGAGWSVYFNTGYAKVNGGDSTQARIDAVNGDVFRLSPAGNWPALAPDSSMTIEMLNRKIKNFTDVPKGFYLVSDHYPIGADIAFIADTPFFADSLDRTLAGKHFMENEQILSLMADSLPPIFPTPKHYAYGNKDFVLDGSCIIVRDDIFEKEALFLQNELGKILISVPKIESIAKEGKRIIFEKKTDVHAEGYELSVDDSGIRIAAATADGAFHGVQSLLSLLPPTAWKEKQERLRVKGVSVQDEPRFAHRAVMLDVARNFQEKKQVLKVLDLMAMYKLNVLHFHLNDDEGWRLEIPGLPELTEVGSKRGHTLDDAHHLLPSYGSGPDVENKTGSGYYTSEDYVEILRYARERHIRVIPEVETPGHARAAIKAMDARYVSLSAKGDTTAAKAYLLRDLQDQSVYRSVQDWNDNVIDVSLPSAYTFLEKVTDELIHMYKEAEAPLTTIHFGGDEVPAGVWQKSPSVQRLLTGRTDLSGVDDLWHYYFGKINTMLKERNLYLSGWEEIGMKKVNLNGQSKMVVEPGFAKENFHVDVWNNLGDNEDLAYRLANAGYQVVLTNVTNFYFDLAYSDSYYEPGQYWGGYVDVDKPFRFVPYEYYRNQLDYATGKSIDMSKFANHTRLTDAGKKNILGLQAPLWSEIITSEERMEYLFLPKLFGLVERAWSAASSWESTTDGMDQAFRHSWSTFVHVLAQKELPKLDHYNAGYLYRIPTAGIRIDGDRIYANVQFPTFKIRYTTDGTEPTAESPLFEQGMQKDKVKALRVFNQNGRGGRTLKVSK